MFIDIYLEVLRHKVQICIYFFNVFIATFPLGGFALCHHAS